jgi:hypothetical protein
MHDWKELVRVRLSPLPLEPSRREEIIEELSQQLEDAYTDARAAGADDSEALQRSLSQFKDWEDLRKNVLHAVNAAKLPVWQQSGILSPRRLWVWTALVLSLALFALFGFRQALATLSISLGSSSSDRMFSARMLDPIERQAIVQGDSRVLAFVALHHPDINMAAGAAEKAIALDPDLTWISARFAQAQTPAFDPAPWMARLKAWDPDNAFPYLLEADQFFDPRSFGGAWERRGAVLEPPGAIAVESDFRLPMQKAFTVPKYDSFAAQRFELDRTVLQQQGWDRPDLLIQAVGSRPIPNLQAIRAYAEYLVIDLGEAAEKAGRFQEAAAQYQTAAQFGVHMQRSATGLERLIAMGIRQQSCEHIVALLRLQDRAGEAALLEPSLGDLHEAFAFKVREYRSANVSADRAASLVLFFGVLVIALAVATLAWSGSVILLRWEKNGSRLLNNFAAVAAIAPPSLLLASLCLYGAYYPYIRHINQFESGDQLFRELLPFWESLAGPWIYRGFWLNMLIWPAAWCVAIAAVGVTTLRWIAARRESEGIHEEWRAPR